MITTMHVKIIVALGFSAIVNAQAMTIDVQGDTIFASGPIDDDLNKFREALDKPGVSIVVFVNSPGGDLNTSLRVGRLIAERKLKTVAAGYCMSACSIMFLGGLERRFSDALRPNANVIGIHGAHDSVSKQVNSNLQPQIFAYYKQRLGDRFNSDIMNTALYKMDDSGAFLRIPEFARNDKAQPYHCASTQMPRRNCTYYATENALSLGIITDATLVAIKLPSTMISPPTVFGQILDIPIPDQEAYFATVMPTWCKTDQCRNAVNLWSKRPENRAIASRTTLQGIGLSNNRDTLQNAVNGAIYQCNHIIDLPVSLCQAQIVNGFDLRPIYRQAVESHQSAHEALSPPTEKTYANEEFGGNFTSAKGYRTQKLLDITPQTLEGIKTIATQDLAIMLKSSAPPTIIEASGRALEVLPRTDSLAFGGNAFDDAAVDKLYNERFIALLALLASDKAAPLVIYCLGRNTWFSVNAAIRAKNAGYTNVYWYRGGVESWVAAKLPTAVPYVRAVAN